MRIRYALEYGRTTLDLPTSKQSCKIYKKKMALEQQLSLVRK